MPRKSMVNTAELRQIFPLRKNTLRHVVEGDGRYPRAMTPSDHMTGASSPSGQKGRHFVDDISDVFSWMKKFVFCL